MPSSEPTGAVQPSPELTPQAGRLAELALLGVLAPDVRELTRPTPSMSWTPVWPA
jgi:hypothetical protein